MSIDWTMLVVVVVVFLLALVIQSLLQARIKVESTGIILAIGITNALSDGNIGDNYYRSLTKPP